MRFPSNHTFEDLMKVLYNDLSGMKRKNGISFGEVLKTTTGPKSPARHKL